MAKGSTLGKDPGVTWMFNDWHGGTMTMTRHQKGCYMDLLTAQFNNGHLSLEAIKNVLGNDFAVWQGVLSKKFIADAEGLFFNERLELEILKRKSFNESRRSNAKGSSAEKHMGIGNGIGNGLGDGLEKGVQGEKHRYQEMIDSTLPTVRQMKTQLSFDQAQKLELAFGDEIVESVFSAMENKADLVKKYSSAYLTALDWCKRRQSDKQPIKIIQGGKSNYKSERKGGYSDEELLSGLEEYRRRDQVVNSK